MLITLNNKMNNKSSSAWESNETKLLYREINRKRDSIINTRLELWREQQESDDAPTLRLMKDAMLFKQLMSYHAAKLINPKLKDLDFFRRIANSLQDTMASHIEHIYSNTSQKNVRKLKHLDEIAVSTIQATQNPPNCTTAKKLFCDLKERCGNGCTLHHYSICFFAAIGTGRIMLWDLSNYPGLSKVIQNPSPCQSMSDINAAKNAPEWRSSNMPDPTPTSTPVVKYTKGNKPVKFTRFAPYTVPSHLLEDIKLVHAEPDLWWMGHVMSYLVRPNDWLLKEIEKTKTEIGFQHPVVGIQVRRTDKIREAPYQSVDTYMDYVSSWYDRYDMEHDNVKRRVFVASDEPSVFTEAKSKYPDYIFLHLPTNEAKISNDGTTNFFMDVFLLRECDYIAVTFSSNVGRLVHELRQTSGKDATFGTANLDFSFYANGMWPLVYEAVLAHHPPEPCELPGDMDWEKQKDYEGICEMTFEVGDKIESVPLLTRGILIGGKNVGTGKAGMFPANKAKPILESAPYNVV
uniref:alpha-(1,6)-fucosyltransferase isoform X2 n=1 Tax=Ciona intestinalis TaxID=7719 RepID=UPI000EF45851|nr:alpha-(1,6)-fucosyltransferase isoform X2 [Ciona intestinalis]|eukprot:XP_026691909.1 alpha-(1,6)-fucosyltransferase isoform X2 [Ciona intestinalis]